MKTMSLFGKLLIDARGPAHQEIPRELTWSNRDIAEAVEADLLVVPDPTERVMEQWKKEEVSLAQAFANRWRNLFDSSENSKSGQQRPTEVEQKLLVRLSREGGLTRQEIENIVIRSLVCGAQSAFFELTKEWSQEERISLLMGEVKLSYHHVSLIHGCVKEDLCLVVKRAFEEGLSPNHTTKDGQGLGHFLVSREMMKVLAEGGMDPNILDKCKKDAKAYWVNKLSVDKQKDLSAAWNEVFKDSRDPLMEKKTLLLGIETKNKALLIRQCEEAGIDPIHKINDLHLLEHVSRAIVSDNRATDSTAAHRWMMTKVPLKDRPEQYWLYHLASGLIDPRSFPKSPAWSICEQVSKMRGEDRINAVSIAINRLTKKKDLVFAWDKLRKTTIDRQSVAANQEGWDTRYDYEKMVDQEVWVNWWKSPGEDGGVRIFSLYEKLGEDNPGGFTGYWTIAQSFFEYLVDKSKEEVAAFVSSLPSHPIHGQGFWCAIALGCSWKMSEDSVGIKSSWFPIDVIGQQAKTKGPGIVLDVLWGMGIRPDEAQTRKLMKAKKDSESMLRVLEAHLIDLTTEKSSGQEGGRRRL